MSRVVVAGIGEDIEAALEEDFAYQAGTGATEGESPRIERHAG